MIKGANMKSFSSNIINDIFDSIDPVEQAKVDAKMLIAAKIADAMKEKGWRKTDLLKAVNKENPSIITKWLSGTHNFTIDTLIELGLALDIDLLNYSEPKEQIVIYFASVSQKASTTCYDDPFTKLSKKVTEEPAYSAGLYHASFNSHKQYAQA